MEIVKFGRTWVINTVADYEHAMEVLDGNEFCADMSDDWARADREKAEIRRQRRDVIAQAGKLKA
jgi:hypothetical protein